MHSCEHLLYLQQTQRAMLASLCQHQGQLDAHAKLAAEFAVPDSCQDASGALLLPKQVRQAPCDAAQLELFAMTGCAVGMTDSYVSNILQESV